MNNNLMNSARYGVPKKNLCYKTYKENTIPQIKFNIPNMKKFKKQNKKYLNM